MNRNGYFAVVLDDTWTNVVRKNATMDVVRGDHITIAYKPDETTFENLRDIMGKRVNAYISELRRNENIELKNFGEQKDAQNRWIIWES